MAGPPPRVAEQQDRIAESHRDLLMLLLLLLRWELKRVEVD